MSRMFFHAQHSSSGFKVAFQKYIFAGILSSLIFLPFGVNAEVRSGVTSSVVFVDSEVSPVARNDSSAGTKLEINFQVSEPTRLAEVMTLLESDAVNSGVELGDVYWPGARLIHNDRLAEVESLRAQVMKSLHELAAYDLISISLIERQIKGWRVGFQPYSSIEFERSRLSNAHNPLLPSGSYTLVLPTRQPRVYFYGLTESYGPQHFYPGQSVRRYIRAHAANGRLLDGVNRDHVSIIRNRKIIQDVPWAIHNADASQLQPSDIVWLGFSGASSVEQIKYRLGWSNVVETLSSLENQVLELATHFIEDESGEWLLQSQASDPSRISKILNHNDWEVLNRDTAATRDGYVSRRITTNNYGEPGLIQMPNARMTDLGELSLSYTDMNQHLRYSVNVQVFDWLQASAFYVRFPGVMYSTSPGFSGDNILTDKGFDAKIRLFQETARRPEVSIGLRDFAGTGLFDSEYIVASKAAGPFDFSLGMSFGRMATRASISNPFCDAISSSFCTRPSGAMGRGGQFEYRKWFSGDASMFGGVEYQTPWQPLRLKVEYDSNLYTRVRSAEPIVPRTPWNFGANYQLNEFVDLRLGYERGDTLTLGVTIRANLDRMNQTKIQPSRVEVTEPRVELVNDVDWSRTDQQLREQFTYTYNQFHIRQSEQPGQSDSNEAAVRGRDIVTLYTYPWRQRNEGERLDRAARILANELPESVDTLEIVEQTMNSPLVRYSIDLDEYRRVVRNEDPDIRPSEGWEQFTRSDPQPRPPVEDSGWVDDYPRFAGKPTFGIAPHWQQSFGSPETFYFYQLYLTAFSNWQINENFFLLGDVGINVLDNYDKFNFTVDAQRSPLPRVRTFVREYLEQDIWLNRLQANYYKALTPEWHAIGYAGLFERMYGGLGGEILYRPLDTAWSVGVDVNRVRQRDFQGGLGFRDYEVTTGHASLYYNVGDHFDFLGKSLLTLSAGQFLAGDRGVNINFQRQFDSGLILGAYAALTDVSSADYGEGSFTKGFFVSIPFDIFSVRPSARRATVAWSPLYRDGGQMVYRRVMLHSLTDPRRPFYTQ